MLPEIVGKMPWTEQFSVCDKSRTVTIPYVEGISETDAIKALLCKARALDSFKVYLLPYLTALTTLLTFPSLRGWRDELYTVHGVDRQVTIERSASPLFGILTFGVHMTAFYESPDSGLMIWGKISCNEPLPGSSDSF